MDFRFLEKFYPKVEGKPLWVETISFLLNTLPVTLAGFCLFVFFQQNDHFWLFLGIFILFEFFVLGPIWKKIVELLGYASPRPCDHKRNGMPSSHMACAAIFAVNITLRTRTLLSLFVAFSLLASIFWQRKYSGMHTSIQLLAGGALGSALGIAAFWVLSIYGPRP